MTAALELPSWAAVSPKRADHIARVAALTQAWAAARGVDDAEAARWFKAAQLHDALRDAPPERLLRYVPELEQLGWPRKLWHGPAAAAAARAEGERDQGVLDAIRYHTVGFAGWDDCGRMLYLADYLEPGRAYDREALDALAARVPRDVPGAMRDVTARRIRWLLDSGARVRPETVDLWNALAAPR